MGHRSTIDLSRADALAKLAELAGAMDEDLTDEQIEEMIDARLPEEYGFNYRIVDENSAK